MENERKVKGLLVLELDPDDEEPQTEEWLLWGKTTFNEETVDVHIHLDNILNQFEGHEVLITIQSLKGPDQP